MPFRTSTLLVSLALAPAVWADDPPNTTRAKGDRAIQTRGILRKYCQECHTPGESARGRLVVLDHGSLTRTDVPARFVEAGSDRSQILDLIADGSMPPGNRKRPTPDEMKVLTEWVTTDRATKYPKTFAEATANDVARTDAERLPDAERAGARYVSFRHLISDDSSPPDLKAAEAKLREALVAASDGKLNRWAYADDTATVLRLDIRTAKWDDPNLFTKVEVDSDDKVADFTPFDLLLLENPHAGSPPPEPKSTYLSTLRRVPFLRGDWLAEALYDGKKTTPLADDLTALTKLSPAVEKKGEKPDGPAFRPFTRTEPVKVPPPPLGSWVYSETGGLGVLAIQKARAISLNGGKEIQSVKKGDSFRLRFSPSHDTHLDLLQVYPTGAVKLCRLPEECQSVKGGATIHVRPGDMDGAFYFDEVPVEAETAPGWMILFASVRKEKRPPLPTVVKSKHLTHPIWRVFPTAPDAAATTVRSVIKLDVTRK